VACVSNPVHSKVSVGENKCILQSPLMYLNRHQIPRFGYFSLRVIFHRDSRPTSFMISGFCSGSVGLVQVHEDTHALKDTLNVKVGRA
jgi:hypothetical protein